MKRKEFKETLFEALNNVVDGMSYDDKMILVHNLLVDYEKDNEEKRDTSNKGSKWTDEELKIILSDAPTKENCVKYARLFKRGYGSIEQIYRWSVTTTKEMTDERKRDSFIIASKENCKRIRNQRIGTFMKLDWGNVLKFADEREYYEVLGFLAKDEEYIRVYTESNDKSGAWAPQGRLLLRNVDISSLPEPLMKAFEISLDGRISETKYVRNLKENHYFIKEVDPTGSDFTKWLYKESLEKVLETVPKEYENDFYRGYHWNCEVVKRVRNISAYDINLTGETKQEEAQLRTEGKKTVYYTTKYERSAQNREEAIRIHGTKCMICGFDFEKKYGELGKGYIEVHHIKPLSDLDEEVVVNPATDLICVCSNCHRMLHRFRSYMVSVEELRRIVKDNE